MTIKYIISLIVVVFILIFILRFNENRNYRLRGSELIEKVEKFKKINGILPSSIKEITNDKEMGEGPYYEKKSDSTYVVYFNIGFDDSLIYSSSNEKWIEKP